jgi:hypothetical protein
MLFDEIYVKSNCKMNEIINHLFISHKNALKVSTSFKGSSSTLKLYKRNFQIIYNNNKRKETSISNGQTNEQKSKSVNVWGVLSQVDGYRLYK